MTSPTLDPQSFKAAVRQHWDASAPGWDAHTPQIRAWLRTATDAMITLAGVKPGSQVLDVAAGAGDQTLDIAERVGPTGTVLATDISPALVALATQRAKRAGHTNVQCQVADGEDLQLGEGQFDAAVCRLGLMLFADPLQGLQQMHHALKPGGRVCTLVFAGPQRNPCVSIVVETAIRHAGRPMPAPSTPGSLFSLGRPGVVDALMQQAGFVAAATTAIDATFHMPSVDDYLTFLRSAASPVVQILAALDERAALAAWDDIRTRLRAYETPTGWAGPNELLLSAAHKPEGHR